VASLTGIAWRYAWRHDRTEAEAVAELKERSGDRADLLAEVAGIEIGFYSGRVEEAQARVAAELCIQAGADVYQMARWTEEGKRRAEAARLPPFSRPGPSPRRP
jgi:hypothetical protein